MSGITMDTVKTYYMALYIYTFMCEPWEPSDEILPFVLDSPFFFIY